jgi:glyoxylase-like metal-dependent hydrolase (beta-lactamase superfamily II)
MKKMMHSLIIWLNVALLSVANAAPTVPDYPAEKLAEHTYVIHGPLGYPSKENLGFMNNPAFVITKTSVVVIDPGSTLETGRMVLRQIRKLTQLPVTHVLNTHVHGDHWLANHAFADVFPKAAFYGHPAMIKKAKDGEAATWLANMKSMTDGASIGTEAVIPDNEVIEGGVLKVGGIEFRIYAPEKAHSHTDVMIEVVEDSVVLLGDNVMSKRFGRMDDGTFRGNIAACDRAMEINAKHYIPGHGQSGSVKLVKDYRDYLAMIYSEVGKYYEEGMADFEMKPLIEKKVSAYHGWSGFEDEFGRHISLAVLEVERAEFE